MEEKQIMASIDSKWITSLVASFQDDNNLYLVMEYLPGGDLATLMMKADEGHITIDENFTRFYIAETVVALQELHKMNFIHRDVKPGNLLLDAKGHIRLADFGSCIQVDEKTGVTSQVTVGTPDYISPEVLQANEGKGAYGKECDFWSAGITLYEMLFGDTPFYAESLAETYHQIMNHQEFFQFPEDVKASSEVMDLMKRLICDRTKRLKTAEEILAHPFFKNMNWQNLQNQTAPFVPKLTSDDDVSNFAEYEDDLDEVQEAKKGVTFGSSKKEFNGNNLSFIGYTFSRNASLIKMLQNKEGNTNDSSVALKKRPSSSFVSEGGWEAKLVAAESELEKLKVRLANETKKIVSLETTQASLEKELSDAKKLSNADKRALEAKQDEISRIEREKKVVQLELDSVKRKHADEIEEKSSLESKLAKITASLDSEKQSSIAAKEQERLALAEKKRLENSLKDANDRVHTQGDKLAVLEKEIVQLNKAKALLEVEVNQLKQANEEASATIAELQANILQLESKISHQEGAKEYAADALSESEKVISELKAALEVAKSQVSRELSEKDQLRKQISFIETQKSAVERELSSVKEKLPSPTSDKPSFFSGKGSSDASKQLEAEIEAKKKLSNQFSAVSQEKTQLEFRLNDAQAKLQDAEREMKNLKSSIKSYEERLAANRKSGSIVRGLVGNKMESSGSEMDLSKISDDQKTKLEKKIADLQKSSALATVEIADLKKKLETETSLKSQLETKVADLEKSVREENALKAKFEAKVNELQTAQATMQKDLQNAKADTKKVMVIKASQEAILADHTKNIALLEMARDELQSKLQVATNSKKDLEQEVEKLKTRLSEQIVNQIDPSEFAQLADECNRIHKEYLDLTGKYDSLKSKYDTVLAENESWKKRNELDTMKITDLTRKVSVMVSSDYLDEQSAPSMVPGFAGTMQRARMNISKMKNMEQKLTTEMARRAALETELQTVKTSKVQLEHEVEELRKQLQQTSFERPGSHLSHSTSARSSTVDGPYSFKKLRPLLFPDHPEQPVLQGWIRMRVSKGTAKKAKFEWTKKFAVVRNSKIYLYDKEKEKDNADIKPLLDLRYDCILRKFLLVDAISS
jgi:serine/threonine protein kinase/predicted  nucleic acid-binding Zn-ribbon protein